MLFRLTLALFLLRWLWRCEEGNWFSYFVAVANILTLWRSATVSNSMLTNKLARANQICATELQPEIRNNFKMHETVDLRAQRERSSGGRGLSGGSAVECCPLLLSIIYKPVNWKPQLKVSDWLASALTLNQWDFVFEMFRPNEFHLNVGASSCVSPHPTLVSLFTVCGAAPGSVCTWHHRRGALCRSA